MLFFSSKLFFIEKLNCNLAFGLYNFSYEFLAIPNIKIPRFVRALVIINLESLYHQRQLANILKNKISYKIVIYIKVALCDALLEIRPIKIDSVVLCVP
jgi:hypothetical protein